MAGVLGGGSENEYSRRLYFPLCVCADVEHFTIR